MTSIKKTKLWRDLGNDSKLDYYIEQTDANYDKEQN